MMDHLEYVGQIMGDYRLLRWLGGGGFGHVYLAERLHEGQLVAVKVLQMHLSKQNDLRSFIQEARTIRLRHPHIVPLLDFGLNRNDTPFLVMEYAPKGTLRDHHHKGSQVPLITAVEYATQVASALQYAHDAHLVHRDVKPENMLVRSDGMILLSDFGIATTAHNTYSLNTTQGMTGTIPYMAPEQLSGEPRPASDQYALAVVIYEWIAGRVPFRGTAIEMAMQHATQPPPSLIIQVPHLPREVEAVLFKALAKDYKERFPSIQTFITTLQQATASYPPAFTQSAFGAITPPPIVGHTFPGTPSMIQPTITQPTKLIPDTLLPGNRGSFVPDTPSPKHFAMAPTYQPDPLPIRERGLSKKLSAFLILLVILLIAGGSYAYSTVSEMQRTAATIAHRDATAVARLDATTVVRATATAAVKDASNAYQATVAQKGIMFGFDAAHTRTNPYEHILNNTTVSQLHQAWTALTGSAISSSPTIANGVVYVGSQDNKLYAFDAITGQPKWTALTGNSIYSSPAIANGMVYIGSNDHKLYAFDAITGQPKWTALTGDSIYSSPAVANGMVYIGSNDNKFYAFDAITGQPKWTALTGFISSSSPAIANGVVYIGSTNDTLYAFDAITGQQKWTALTGNRIFSSPVVANNVVYIGSNKLYAFDATTGQPKWAALTENLIASSPTIANGMVYIGTNDSSLYTFSL